MIAKGSHSSEGKSTDESCLCESGNPGEPAFSPSFQGSSVGREEGMQQVKRAITHMFQDMRAYPTGTAVCVANWSPLQALCLYARAEARNFCMVGLILGGGTAPNNN